MRRPQRRLHLLMWMALAPAIAAGVFLALRHAPSDPRADLAEILVTDGAD